MHGIIKNAIFTSANPKGGIGVSGSLLKCIALVAMSADHCAVAFCDQSSDPYFFMRTVGRIAFPIFAFFTIEGFVHTRDKRRYFTGILILGLLSEPMWRWFSAGIGSETNVLFTLVIGIATLMPLSLIKKERQKICSVWKFTTHIIISSLIAVGGVYVLTPDYGIYGVLLISWLYALHSTGIISRLLLLFPFMILIQGVLGGILATAVLSCYNGERGFIKSSWAKYLFYALYPIHLLIICLLT